MSRSLTTREAMVEGITQAMDADERVFLMGVDIGAYGGAFQQTAGLMKRFGEERVMDAPISESAFVGASVGAALAGLRPIVDLMFSDFIGVCMSQMTHHMAKLRYESAGRMRVPVVVTAPIGAGLRDGPQHSGSPYGTLAHFPGLKVVVPSSPADAKGLIGAAIRDDDPVVFLFHKQTLGLAKLPPNPRASGPVPDHPYTTPIGTAEVKRKGRDVTLVAVGWMVHRCLDAADELASEGIEAEVLDLRSISPLDRDAVLESIRRTRRLVVVDEDHRSFGVSGEVLAIVAETAFGQLDAAPRRVVMPDASVPFSPPLEDALIPSVSEIVAASREVCR